MILFISGMKMGDVIRRLQINVIVVVAVLSAFSQALPETPATCSVIQGLPGLNGRDGRDGVHGHKGDPGSPGQPGSPGMRGAAGPPGKTGPKGDQGSNGVAGLKGSKGDKGDTDARTAEKVSSLEEKIAILEKHIGFLKRLLQYSLKGVKISGDKVYVPINLTADYSGAQAACEREGGTLPTPTNGAEDATIHEVAKELQIHLFLGINDRKEEGVFMSLDGKKITYSNWRQNEPNGNTAENCAEMAYYITGWNDRACHIAWRVVCEF
ncbi:pulmonary surfactant-associated protein D-like isoform X2 [Spea bombifrons]|uniref:pulmonary surfactant-associated protein D-like isoform X2 n=1 Tax=Spea bombifrons TaxID=233779 RepID=UPI00234A338D|nr:pulmonary surfactant-associated protein D-like isoform X2 [Spea bombifrons]